MALERSYVLIEQFLGPTFCVWTDLIDYSRFSRKLTKHRKPNSDLNNAQSSLSFVVLSVLAGSALERLVKVSYKTLKVITKRECAVPKCNIMTTMMNIEVKNSRLRWTCLEMKTATLAITAPWQGTFLMVMVLRQVGCCRFFSHLCVDCRV